MSKKIELLAPAGDTDALHAAVENGADAVYLGGKLFNARQSAGNFDMHELKGALDYAHVRGVNIYLAMNTLVADNEMEQAVSAAKEAYILGIDGIIVQDIGLSGILHRAIPGLPLHASTQMTIYNLEGVRALEKMGFKRAVLARELSLEEIRHIAGNTSLEIEIFVHGALCISYSGQCLMSSLIGGRSGNRGRCAQPCRLRYKLVHDEKETQGNLPAMSRYLLSPKDLCSLQSIGDIAASGVKSLKIEGRMKSPEYVATVVRIYRKYLDMVEQREQGDGSKEKQENRPLVSPPLVSPEQDMRDLTRIFNRGGFSTGYLLGKQGRDMMCFEKPKNWGVYLGEVLAFDRAGEMVTVKLEDSLSIGDGIEVWNGEEESPGTVVTALRMDGRNVKTAGIGDTVLVGNINGRIYKDCKVYKTSDKGLSTAARETFSGKPHRRISLHGHATLEYGKPLILQADDGEGNTVQVESAVMSEAAINKPLTEDRLVEQVKKTGSTPFEFTELEIRLDDGLSIPVSEINEVRRRALEEMESRRAQRYAGVRDRAGVEAAVEREFRGPADGKRHAEAAAGVTGANTSVREKMKAALYFYNWSGSLDYAGLNADRLYFPFRSLFDAQSSRIFASCREKGIEVFIGLPAVTRGNYDRLIGTKLACAVKPGINGVLAGNPGTVEQCRDIGGFRLLGDHTLNMFNRFSVDEAAAMGLMGITPSLELTLGQVCGIARSSKLAVETAVYGRLPLMTSEYCPVGSVKGGFAANTKCDESCKKGSYRLKDRMGMEFPVLCDNIDCRSVLLNANVLFVLDTLKKLHDSGVDSMRFYIWDEPPEMIRGLVDLFKTAAETGSVETAGHEVLVDRIKFGGFTKGHYFRGV